MEQDHVFAVIASSAFAFEAAPYLASHGIPVVGVAIDSTEWITDRNMFSVIGTQDYSKVYSQFGLFFKLVGATNLGSVGYSVSPSSSQSAKSTAISAQEAGLKVGYLNASFPFGGTNVGPAVLAMKAAGIDAFSGSIETNTEFAMITGLRQQGVHLKAPLLATGYGGDLTSGGPGADQAAQGVYFLTAYQPVEMNTAGDPAVPERTVERRCYRAFRPSPNTTGTPPSMLSCRGSSWPDPTRPGPPSSTPCSASPTTTRRVCTAATR